MKRFAPFLIAAALTAQQAAPPAVDEALRTAVNSFYGAFVEGKFRKAYALVAEDSQDHFLEMGKPEMNGFTIQKIDWNSDASKATVTIEVDTEFRFSGNVIPVKRQLESTWRLEAGEWLWYYVPPTKVKTPFGEVTVDPDARKKRQLDVKKEMEKKAVTPDELAAGVEVVTKEITYQRDQPAAASIEIKNNLSGWVKVELFGKRIPGMTVEKFNPDVPPNGTLKIDTKWQPAKGAPDQIELTVVCSPVGGSFTIPVYWKD
jgi:hypothetical protein